MAGRFCFVQIYFNVLFFFFFVFFCRSLFISDSSLSSHPGFDFPSVVFWDTIIFSLTNFAHAYIKSVNSVLLSVGIFVHKSFTFSVSDLNFLQSWFWGEDKVVTTVSWWSPIGIWETLSPQIPRTILSIQADLNNAVVWINIELSAAVDHILFINRLVFLGFFFKLMLAISIPLSKVSIHGFFFSLLGTNPSAHKREWRTGHWISQDIGALVQDTWVQSQVKWYQRLKNGTWCRLP